MRQGGTWEQKRMCRHPRRGALGALLLAVAAAAVFFHTSKNSGSGSQVAGGGGEKPHSQPHPSPDSTAVKSSCRPVENCAGTTECFSSESVCEQCLPEFYRLSRQGSSSTQCLHRSVTLAQAGFPEGAAGMYTLHLSADGVPQDLSIGATLRIPAAVELSISKMSSGFAKQPRINVAFDVQGTVRLNGLAGLVQVACSAGGIFTAANSPTDEPLYVGGLATNGGGSTSGDEASCSITPVISRRESSGATLQLERVAMPVNVLSVAPGGDLEGTQASVCSVLADSRNNFTFTSVRLMPVLDTAQLSSHGVTLDGSSAHELVVTAHQAVDLGSFTIPAGKQLTVRGDKIVAPPELSMVPVVAAQGTLRLERVSAWTSIGSSKRGFHPELRKGGSLQADHVSLNFTLLQGNIFSPVHASSDGTITFIESSVEGEQGILGSVHGGPQDFELKLEAGAVVNIAALKIQDNRTLSISGAKGPTASRVIMSSSASQAVDIGRGSQLRLADLEMPRCGLDIATEQQGGVSFSHIKLSDNRNDYAQGGQSRGVQGRYMACVRVDSWDDCHTYCGGSAPWREGQPNCLPTDVWGDGPKDQGSAHQCMATIFDADRGSYQQCAQDSAQCTGRFRNGCQCGPLATGCWRNHSCPQKYWLPAADCGGSIHAGLAGTAQLTASTSEKECQAENATQLRNIYCDTKKCIAPCSDYTCKKTGNDNCICNSWTSMSKWTGGCDETAVTGKYDWCSKRDSCPWTDSELCTDKCLEYGWVYSTVPTRPGTPKQLASSDKYVTSVVPACAEDGFVDAFGRVDATTQTLQIAVPSVDYGTVNGDSTVGYSLDLVYTGLTYPRFNLTSASPNGALTTVAGQGHTATQITVGDLMVRQDATLHLKDVALFFPSLALSNDSLTFLRVDGLLKLEKVAVPGSMFTTAVSSIFQVWTTGRISFIGARLYNERNFPMKSTCPLLPQRDGIPSVKSPEHFSVTSALCAPSLNITLATLGGDARSDQGLRMDVDQEQLTAAVGAGPTVGIYNFESDGALRVDPPDFVPGMFGFFAPASSTVRSSVPAGVFNSYGNRNCRYGDTSCGSWTDKAPDGHGGCQITDRGRCVSQHFGFLQHDESQTVKQDCVTVLYGDGEPHLVHHACSNTRADTKGAVSGMGTWASQHHYEDHWKQGQWRHDDGMDGKSHDYFVQELTNQPAESVWTPSAERPDYWIPDPNHVLQGGQNWGDPRVASVAWSEFSQWGCSISSQVQCSMPMDTLQCSSWACNSSTYSAEQCAIVEGSCDAQALSPWSSCDRPRNQSVGLGGRQLNCDNAQCKCSAGMDGCADIRKPSGCFDEDINCRHAGYAESTCAEKETVYETACRAMAPSGGWIAYTENLELYLNQSTKTYYIKGDVSDRVAAWTRNSTDYDTSYTEMKGANWSMWNLTLLANHIEVSSSGTWDGQVRQYYGPSLPGSPVGTAMLPGDTKLAWGDTFGYASPETFTRTPWKICFG